MLRCIDNAIGKGRLTREQGEALQDRVDGLLREGLAAPEVRARMAEDLAIEARERKRRGLLMELRRRSLTDFMMSHKNARGENDPAEALWMMLEHFGQANVKDIETTRLTILGRVHGELESLLDEFRKGAITGDFRRRAGPQAARMENIVRELFGVDSGDASAKALASAWGQVTERLRLRFNAAGGNIRKLARDGLSWGLPQTHDAEALLNAKFNGKTGRAAWVDYMMQPGTLDRQRTVSSTGSTFSDNDLRQALADIWEKITTDGWIDRDPSYVPYGKGALGKQKDAHHRFLHFASPDAWMAYQRNFGEGDPFAAMMGHISIMARDIATMEVLGPNPETMRNYLKQIVLKQAAKAKPIGRTLETEGGRVADLLAGVVDAEVGRGWLSNVTEKVNALADLQRRLRQLGAEEQRPGSEALKLDADGKVMRGPDGEALWETTPTPRQAVEQQIKDLTKDLDELKKALTMIEARGASERRAGLATDLEKTRAEIDGLARKGERQLTGLSRRNRRKLAQLRAREEELETQLDLSDQADTSISAEHPDVAKEITDTIDRIVKDEVRIDPDTGAAAADGFRSVDDPLSKARVAIARHDAMWDLIRGTHFAPISTKWANGLQATRNVMTGALLGSASVSALGDINFQRHARKFAGMPMNTLRIIGEYVSMIGRSNKREAVRAGLILDSALHVMHQQARYVEGINTATYFGFIADRVISASGLSWITQAGKHAFGLELQGFLADNVGRGFADLDPAVRRMFQRHGITEADWNKIRTADLYEPHAGASFLRPNEIEGKAGVDVAEKYLGMILRETRYAVPEGGVRSRSYLASGRPGSLPGELGRNFAQFKSFGVAVLLLHGGRIAHEFQRGNVRSGTSMALGMAVSAAIAGVIVNELLEIINGREPVIAAMLERGETPGWEYWGAGLLRAGGLGIYGDFLFQGLSRAGGLASVLIGPVGGFGDRIRARSLGSAQEGLEGKDMRLGREGVSTIREVMPGSTLWYLRLVKERWFLNQLQLAFDPDAGKVFERHMSMQKKNYGNEYWWKPGETAPRGLPWQASPPGMPAAPQTPPKAGPGLAIGARIAQTDAKRFVVIDGDTVAVGGHHWRLTGYDTPELYKGKVKTKERFVGVQAAVRLGELLRSGKAELEVTDAPDRWGRGRARLTVDGRDIADVMKEEGLVKKKR